MMLNPEAQRRAQEKLDQVIGHDRLPDFNDLGEIPYVRAIVMEAFRWQQVLPLS